MKLYVIGPVTGLPMDNRPNFMRAKAQLESLGYEVEIPHQSVPYGAEWTDAMRLSIGRLVEADGVVMLDGWNISCGARIEYNLARDLEIPAFSMETWVTGAKHFLKGGTPA